MTCVAACIATALLARAAVELPAKDETDALGGDNPYGAITNRNIFDLRKIIVTTNEKPAEPPENIKLTGITTISGTKQALLKVSEPGATGRSPASHSLILSEGERFGALEVLEINPGARTAKIRSDKIESLIYLGAGEKKK